MENLVKSVSKILDPKKAKKGDNEGDKPNSLGVGQEQVELEGAGKERGERRRRIPVSANKDGAQALNVLSLVVREARIVKD